VKLVVPATGAPRRRWAPAAAIAALAALALLPSSAGAQDAGDVPNWPELLPPNPSNSAAAVFPGFDVCPGGDPSCPEAVILEMYERWRPLSQACDHRAVFALTYLRTTEEYFRTVTAEPQFFDDRPWVSHEDAVFAEFYFKAEDDFGGAGGDVPEAWRIAFDAARSPNVTGAGDLFLGMSAHINRDLPYTLGAVGLVPPGGGSRKTDHDRVNLFLNRIADPLQRELGDRYDPFFTLTDAEPSPFDEIGILQLVRSWRQAAWQNAELLVNAADGAQREQASSWIETYSTVAANGILAANTIPGYGKVRDEWCAQHNPPSARLRLEGRARRGRLPVSVYADGPARFELLATLRRPGAGSSGGDASLTLTKPVEVVFSAEGWQRAALKLTRRGRRALARAHDPEVSVTLEAPHGFEIRERGTL
jgi:Family of unknown function (DUF5995)